MFYAEAIINYSPGPDHLGVVVRPLFSGSDPGVLTVKLAPGTELSGSFSGEEPRPSLSVHSIVTCSAGTYLFQSSNVDRRNWTVYNNSTANLFVKFGSGASTGSFSVRLVPDAYFELPYPVYTGEITGFWLTSGSGNAQIDEMVT